MPIPPNSYTRSLPRTALIFMCLMVCFSFASLAQQPGKKQSFALGVEGGVNPDVANTQYANLGITARYAFLLGPGYIYIGTGYMVSREGFNFQIPIRAGYKFIFSKKFFIREELGYCLFKDPDSYAGSTVSGAISIATGAGIQFGIFDLGIQYDAIVNHTNFSTIGFIIAWNF
jgi:hypothetical protein